MADGRYCERGIYHTLAGYFPSSGTYEVSCACGHKEQAAPLFTDPAEALADALLKLRGHITNAGLTVAT